MLKSSETDQPATAGEEGEAKAAFHLRMRARGVRDLAVLRAFEIVPRAHFVPERYVAMAGRNLPLPIACGQTSHEPWLLARAVEALGVAPSHRVLEIGSGSGYVTAVLAQLAGDVLGLERFASLAAAAQARLDALGLANAAIVWGDGLAAPPVPGTFERILVHGALAEPPVSLAERLSPGGRIVAALAGGDGEELVRWDLDGRDLAEPVSIGPCRLGLLVAGLAATL